MELLYEENITQAKFFFSYKGAYLYHKNKNEYYQNNFLITEVFPTLHGLL